MQEVAEIVTNEDYREDSGNTGVKIQLEPSFKVTYGVPGKKTCVGAVQHLRVWSVLDLGLGVSRRAYKFVYHAISPKGG